MKRQKRLIIYTGNGKGKTTAALGQVWRALGHDLHCGVIQFIKHHPHRFGEYRYAQRQGVSWYSFGEGFTWDQQDPDISRATSFRGWEFFTQLVSEGQFDLLVLDEFSYPFHQLWLSEQEVCRWLKLHRELLPHLVITGRDMPRGLIELADTVTSMDEVKHGFSLHNMPAQRGIEF